ncbi:hypothetical protein [Shouchella lehensis]|uniref:Uncharacterized protein n=1 Tax=Shouchella lehensis G1 TaxID=1246626 RepID=A0A060M048_9BACI|nr:hypothetical protein [Shouchella lehensis]AIC95395.1 hypothetical protein BleG1_2831 [Shouchella lehensis G1]
MDAIKLEWENVQYWGEINHPDLGLVKTYFSGGSDVYTNPEVDEDGNIYTNKFCLDSFNWTDSIEIGTYEKGMKFINFIEFV